MSSRGSSPARTLLPRFNDSLSPGAAKGVSLSSAVRNNVISSFDGNFNIMVFRVDGFPALKNPVVRIMYASDTKQTKAKTNSGGAVEFNELVSFRKEKDMDTIKVWVCDSDDGQSQQGTKEQGIDLSKVPIECWNDFIEDARPLKFPIGFEGGIWLGFAACTLQVKVSRISVALAQRARTAPASESQPSPMSYSRHDGASYVRLSYCSVVRQSRIVGLQNGVAEIDQVLDFPRRKKPNTVSALDEDIIVTVYSLEGFLEGRACENNIFVRIVYGSTNEQTTKCKAIRGSTQFHEKLSFPKHRNLDSIKVLACSGTGLQLAEAEVDLTKIPLEKWDGRQLAFKVVNHDHGMAGTVYLGFNPKFPLDTLRVELFDDDQGASALGGCDIDMTGQSFHRNVVASDSFHSSVYDLFHSSTRRHAGQITLTFGKKPFFTAGTSALEMQSQKSPGQNSFAAKRQWAGTVHVKVFELVDTFGKHGNFRGKKDIIIRLSIGNTGRRPEASAKTEVRTLANGLAIFREVLSLEKGIGDDVLELAVTTLEGELLADCAIDLMSARRVYLPDVEHIGEGVPFKVFSKGECVGKVSLGLAACAIQCLIHGVKGFAGFANADCHAQLNIYSGQHTKSLTRTLTARGDAFFDEAMFVDRLKVIDRKIYIMVYSLEGFAFLASTAGSTRYIRITYGSDEKKTHSLQHDGILTEFNDLISFSKNNSYTKIRVAVCDPNANYQDVVAETEINLEGIPLWNDKPLAFKFRSNGSVRLGFTWDDPDMLQMMLVDSQTKDIIGRQVINLRRQPFFDSAEDGFPEEVDLKNKGSIVGRLYVSFAKFPPDLATRSRDMPAKVDWTEIAPPQLPPPPQPDEPPYVEVTYYRKNTPYKDQYIGAVLSRCVKFEGRCVFSNMQY